MYPRHVWLNAFIHGLLVSGQGFREPLEQCDYQVMEQKIDHGNGINGTFQQRYSIFMEHFKPGGAILFFQGEETNLDCAVRARPCG